MKALLLYALVALIAIAAVRAGLGACSESSGAAPCLTCGYPVVDATMTGTPYALEPPVYALRGLVVDADDPACLERIDVTDSADAEGHHDGAVVDAYFRRFVANGLLTYRDTMGIISSGLYRGRWWIIEPGHPSYAAYERGDAVLVGCR